MNIVGLLLAGGQSRRMGGGDKALRLLGGRSLLERVIERLRPQTAALVLNANGDPRRFAGFGLPVVADSIADFAGPLAGILAGLDWAAAHRPNCPVVASVATDAPFLPEDLAAGARAVYRGGRDHLVLGIDPVVRKPVILRRHRAALVIETEAGGHRDQQRPGVDEGDLLAQEL